MLSEIQRVIQSTLQAWGLTDLAIGTVISVAPLQVQIGERDIIPAAGLLLSDAVLEKKIDLRHNHFLPPHSHELIKDEDPRVAEEGPLYTSIELVERPFFDDVALPVINGFAYLQRALQVGDKVALLAVMRKQRYIILFRLREGARP